MTLYGRKCTQMHAEGIKLEWCASVFNILAKHWCVPKRLANTTLHLHGLEILISSTNVEISASFAESWHSVST